MKLQDETQFRTGNQLVGIVDALKASLKTAGFLIGYDQLPDFLRYHHPLHVNP